MKTQRKAIDSFKQILMLGIIICFIFSMNNALSQSDPDTKSQRYYYDFQKKKLLKTQVDNSDEVLRPLGYRANKDLQIEIFNYNPLRDQIIIENTFSERFMADTASFARFVVFPNVSNITAPPKSDTTQKETKTAKGKPGSKKEPPEKSTVKDCEIFLGYIEAFNEINKTSKTDFTNYKNFLSTIEIIQDDYDYFKQQDILSGPEIKSKIDDFLRKLIENASTNIASSTVKISSEELSNLESNLFLTITNDEKRLEDLKKNVSELTNENCKNYVKLNNKFNDAYSELKGKITELNNSRIEKIRPSLNKVLLLYDLLVKYSKGVTNYITPALTIDKDLHTITIYKKELGGNDKVLVDYINVEPVRGWKIDVAPGIFVSGLHDDQFTKKSKDSIFTTKYVSQGVIRDTIVTKTFNSIYKTDQIPVSFGGMIFLHAHTQIPKLLNYGCYIGFGALFNDQTRWTTSLGGSIIIGKKQRFNINIGAAMAQVDRLQQPYETNTWYQEPIDNIPITKVWKVNFLLGCSWNLK